MLLTECRSRSSLAMPSRILPTPWMTVLWFRPPRARPVSVGVMAQFFNKQVHRHLPSLGNGGGSAPAQDLFLGDVVVAGHCAQNLRWRKVAPRVGANDGVQLLRNGFRRQRRIHKLRHGDDAVETRPATAGRCC